MLVKIVAVLPILSALVNLSYSYKILVVYPFPASSHNILGNSVVNFLLKAGHEITYITPFPLKDTHPNLQQIDVSSCNDQFDVGTINVYNLINKLVEPENDNNTFHSIFNLAKAVVKSGPVQKLLSDPGKKFDLVIAEYMYNDLYSGFAAVFECPFIWILPYEPYITILNNIGTIPNPAYVPTAISDITHPFSFVERVQVLWNYLTGIILKEFFHLNHERQVYEKAFGPAFAKKNRPTPPFNDVKYNISIILGNTDFATGFPYPYPANYKSIAGFFIDENVKPLPEDLQTMLDNAKDGFIYFSLGSNLKSKDLPDSIKRRLLDMFAERKEVVVWKFEEKMENLPKNVHVIQWAPQQSVLAHPNCKLFITHGGLLSITEAVNFGIPLIGLPAFGDQFNNVNRMVLKGAALRVDLSYDLADDLEFAICKMISNPRYAETARRLSIVHHDRLVSPGTELVHWVEHVVRTRGAHHLRSPSLQLLWYQKLYLDLVMVVILTTIALKFIVTRLISLAIPKKKVTV